MAPVQVSVSDAVAIEVGIGSRAPRTFVVPAGLVRTDNGKQWLRVCKKDAGVRKLLAAQVDHGFPRRDAIIAKTDIVERLCDARAAAIVCYISDNKAMTDDYLRHNNRYTCVTKDKKHISRYALATFL